MKVILKLSEHGEALMLWINDPALLAEISNLLNVGTPVTNVYPGLWIESSKPNKPSLTIIVDASFQPAPGTDNPEI